MLPHWARALRWDPQHDCAGKIHVLDYYSPTVYSPSKLHLARSGRGQVSAFLVARYIVPALDPGPLHIGSLALVHPGCSDPGETTARPVRVSESPTHHQLAERNHVIRTQLYYCTSLCMMRLALSISLFPVPLVLIRAPAIRPLTKPFRTPSHDIRVHLNYLLQMVTHFGHIS